jgi:NADPH-dependent 7-cyano-7-deazaguanine reductase QueF
MIDTIDCDADVRCTYRYDLTARCPVVDERDHYAVTVAWTPAGETFEKHALEDTLDSLTGRKIAHEPLTERLYEMLSDAAVADLEVLLQDTAHADMEVVKR